MYMYSSKPAEADLDAVTPTALMMVTVTLTVSFAGTEHRVLDWFVDDVVHVTIDLVIRGVHTSSLDVFVAYKEESCISSWLRRYNMKHR